ncbi:TfuA-like protein [Devosia sp.]|uniref:TfuA-like protein n=1 Tax=Devosia sp. TaxID=1871048 RepID=UPI003BA9AB16
MKVLFAGPSLHGQEYVRAELELRAPARQGDVYTAVREGAVAIGLVDGVFGAVPSVWHKEILFALSEGVRVIGGGSLGALRAAECHAFGMEAIGTIAADYLSGARTEDSDVCLAHCPAELGFMPLSEPLVDVETTLLALEANGVISAAEDTALLAAASALYFGARTVEALTGATALPPDRCAAIERAYRAGRISVKATDALAVIDRLRALPDERGSRPGWRFVESDPWRHFLTQQAGA